MRMGDRIGFGVFFLMIAGYMVMACYYYAQLWISVARVQRQFEQTKSVVETVQGTLVSDGIETFYSGRHYSPRFVIEVKLDDGRICRLDIDRQDPSSLRDLQLRRGEKVRIISSFKPGFPLSQEFKIISSL